MQRSEKREFRQRTGQAIGDLVLRPSEQSVTVAGQVVNLTRSEFALLTTLANSPGRVYSRSQLVHEVWAGKLVSERAVDSHIKNLRSKVEPDPRHPQYIITVHSVGYRLSPGTASTG